MPGKHKRIAAILVLWALVPARPARAYEAATTLAGITGRAALASRLHRRLLDRFGRSLGLFDALRLRLHLLPDRTARDLRVRLLTLDPAEGYAPEDVAERRTNLRAPERQTALGWLTAGTVLESVPAWRVRHHFLDPRTGEGLSRLPEVSGGAAALRAVSEGLSGVRELLSGAAFDGTGTAATAWLLEADNDLSLPAFQRAYEQAVVAETEEARETALAQALLAAGAMLNLLESMGDPAHVRNDFVQALVLEGGRYQRWVAERYGRAGVPAPLLEVAATDRTSDAPITRLSDLFVDRTGKGAGLAERTRARFFSAGTLPGARLGDTPALQPGAAYVAPLLNDARGATTVPAPARWPVGSTGYMGSPVVRHLVAWQRTQGGDLRFLLDERCYKDYAQALLPEIGRYAVRALDLLFRGDLELAFDRDQAALRVRTGDEGLGAGTLIVLGEAKDGRRRQIASQKVPGGAASSEIALVPVSDAGIFTRLAVLFRGADSAGEPVLTSAQISLLKD